MVVDKFRSVQKITKPILKIFKKFCKTDRQTGSPVEVPPELKNTYPLTFELFNGF